MWGLEYINLLIELTSEYLKRDDKKHSSLFDHNLEICIFFPEAESHLWCSAIDTEDFIGKIQLYPVPARQVSVGFEKYEQLSRMQYYACKTKLDQDAKIWFMYPDFIMSNKTLSSLLKISELHDMILSPVPALKGDSYTGLEQVSFSEDLHPVFSMNNVRHFLGSHYAYVYSEKDCERLVCRFAHLHPLMVSSQILQKNLKYLQQGTLDGFLSNKFYKSSRRPLIRESIRKEEMIYSLHFDTYTPLKAPKNLFSSDMAFEYWGWVRMNCGALGAYTCQKDFFLGDFDELVPFDEDNDLQFPLGYLTRVDRVIVGTMCLVSETLAFVLRFVAVLFPNIELFVLKASITRKVILTGGLTRRLEKKLFRPLYEKLLTIR